MKTINYHMLQAFGACEEHLNLFLDTFGDGEVELSQENLEKAQQAKLDITFLKQFLSISARAEYKKARGEALAEYDKVWDQAWNEYNKVCNEAAQAEYEKVRGLALGEYDKVRLKSLAEYDKMCGLALIRILNADT